MHESSNFWPPALRKVSVISMCLLSVCSVTPSFAGAPVCELRVLPSPTATATSQGGSWKDGRFVAAPGEIKDYATTRLGMLFAATERAVFVYSPWGWNQIWSPAQGDKVEAIGVIRGAKEEVLLAGTEEALWEISWRRGADRRSPWAAFHYDFRSRAIEQKRHSGLRAIYRNDDESLARGYALDDSGQLIPVQVTTDVKLGAPVRVPGAQPSVTWSPGPNGWSFAWGYTASTLLTLNPSGRVASSIDLEATLEPAHTRQRGITCVFADTVQRRLYVGSDFGALVGEFKPDSFAPSGSFFRIQALGLATVETMAVVAGRFL